MTTTPLALTLERDGRTILSMTGSGSGTGLWVRDITGWDSSPSARTEARTAYTAGGTTSAPHAYDGRTITISGWADCADETDTIQVSAHVKGLWPDDTAPGSTVLRTSHHGVTLWAPVDLDGTITAEPDCTTRTVEIQIPLYAPRPWQYGARRWSQCRSTPADYGLSWPLSWPLDWGTAGPLCTGPLTNRGTCPARPVIVLTGNALAGAAVSDGQGHELVYRGPVSTRSPVTLDCRAGTVTGPGGGSMAQLLTGRGWWTVPPDGGSVTPAVRCLGSEGTAVADITIYDTYV